MKDEFSIEAKFYDKTRGRYDYDVDVTFLDDLFRKYGCKSVIDIGCGTGNHALRLSKLGYSVWGVDISPTILEIAKKKDKKTKIKFLQGNMTNLEKVIPKSEKFDVAICLGQVSSSLLTNKDVKAFFNGLQKILRKKGLFVFNARNARKINEEYLNKLHLDRMVNEEKLQLLILNYNTRDPQDPNTIIWRPIYLFKENDNVDLQIREHKLRWFEFSALKKMIRENGFKIVAVYSGPGKEEFEEKKDTDMWFVATVK